MYDERHEETHDHSEKGRFDHGPDMHTMNVQKAANANRNYRTALWTGEHLQFTMMDIPVGGDVGLEVHPYTDQFLRIEGGTGLVEMGEEKDKLDHRREVNKGYAVFVPAYTWHNITNAGDLPLKISSIYAPPHHPRGTMHKTKKDAATAEDDDDWDSTW